MSADEAYARYMAGGSRSSSYQRALGEDYRTTWHANQGAGANTRPSPETDRTPGRTESFLGHVWRGVNAAVNTAAEPVAIAADLFMAGAGRAYTALTGEPVDMPFISFMSQDVAGGATTAELLHAQNPFYGLMVTADQALQAWAADDAGAMAEIVGEMLGGRAAGRRGAPIAANTRFSNIQPVNSAERSFIANAQATFSSSPTWTSMTRHRGELVIQRSDIELTPQNLRLMMNGHAPMVKNSRGEWENVVLHHVGRQTGRMIEVLSSHNEYNSRTGGVLHI